ncbi:site-specific DNA-methyltransferase [Candidatus Parabeggiatoa sp. HSG14]|uniref:site-specific DNA-methyltransferase n=1 Tax=Candidatus Parabeggiatoa sp. HSG14 TaxID=3055593 RepID=UPI0025A7BAFF|nr:site-specific DNA-methyltransferase [Thiotrichales bacterium HSG14]
MATGIPKKDTSAYNSRVRLAYEGKISENEIIKGDMVQYHRIYSHSSGKKLYFGDNLDVLRLLAFDSAICGKINLIYIDPPFATQNQFVSRKQSKAYEDILTGAAFVEFLRQRLVLLHRLLSNNGSIYLHLDEKMIFEMKLIMDEIFGVSNYRNMIIRKKCNPKNYTRKAYGNITDFILFYTKSDKYVWNKQTIPLSEDSKKEYQYIEEKTGRKFMKVPIHAPGTRNGETGKPWRGKMPPQGKHWQYPPKLLDEMDTRGEIFWSKNGNPRRKVYLDEHQGVGVQDIWLEFRDAHNQNIKITGYPTEKNPDLLRRIIAASSNQGDIVLDCFAGSGTTLAIANEMQRNWIGVDNSIEALKTILHRFERGIQPMGDFVKKTSNKNNGQQTLFDSADDSCLYHYPNPQHKAITDFSIFIPYKTTSGVIATINDWKIRNIDTDFPHEKKVNK